MATRKTRTSSKRIAPALAHVNRAFHSAYDRSTADSEDEYPVFVLFGDELVLHRASSTETFLAVPAEFHATKSAVHAPVAAFTLLVATAGQRFSAELVAQLKKLRDRSTASLDKIDDGSGGDLLRDTVAFLDHVLAKRVVGKKALETFARSCGRKIRKQTDRAAQLELDCLHSSVEQALARLSVKERRGLQVVVAGQHQARDRSLGMQYFRKRLREKAGRDERVVYAEGASSIAEALAVIGKKRVDRELAQAFFGDVKRMQRDVLGDATKRILSVKRMPPIAV